MWFQHDRHTQNISNCAASEQIFKGILSHSRCSFAYELLVWFGLSHLSMSPQLQHIINPQLTHNYTMFVSWLWAFFSYDDLEIPIKVLQPKKIMMKHQGKFVFGYLLTAMMGCFSSDPKTYTSLCAFARTPVQCSAPPQDVWDFSDLVLFKNGICFKYFKKESVYLRRAWFTSPESGIFVSFWQE